MFLHVLHVEYTAADFKDNFFNYSSLFLFLLSDNVELILKDIGSRLGSESQEAEQPDYDSVASDEDAEREPGSGKDERTKVCRFCKYLCDAEPNLHKQSGSRFAQSHGLIAPRDLSAVLRRYRVPLFFSPQRACANQLLTLTYTRIYI